AVAFHKVAAPALLDIGAVVDAVGHNILVVLRSAGLLLIAGDPNFAIEGQIRLFAGRRYSVRRRVNGVVYGDGSAQSKAAGVGQTAGEVIRPGKGVLAGGVSLVVVAGPGHGNRDSIAAAEHNVRLEGQTHLVNGGTVGHRDGEGSSISFVDGGETQGRGAHRHFGAGAALGQDQLSDGGRGAGRPVQTDAQRSEERRVGEEW